MASILDLKGSVRGRGQWLDRLQRAKILWSTWRPWLGYLDIIQNARATTGSIFGEETHSLWQHSSQRRSALLLSRLRANAHCLLLIYRYRAISGTIFTKVEVIHQGPAMVSEVCAQVCRIKLKRP
jgi:hypothetical protein